MSTVNIPQIPQEPPPGAGFAMRTGTLMQAIRGPLMMITLGGLLALDSMGGYALRHTWPVLLIIYGLLRLFERMEGTPSGYNS